MSFQQVKHDSISVTNFDGFMYSDLSSKKNPEVLINSQKKNRKKL